MRQARSDAAVTRSRHPQAAATRWRSCPTDGVRRSLLVIDLCRVLNPHVLLERPAGRRRADPLAVGQRVAANPAAPGDVWYRGAPVASAARECHVTIPRNVDRVRNPAGVEGLAARPLRWSVTRASGSVARPLAVSRRSVSGCRSTARGAGKGRNAADGPGRRAIVPTAPQRGDRARLPLSSVQHVGGGK
jgi:hypothetical protein